MGRAARLVVALAVVAWSNALAGTGHAVEATPPSAVTSLLEARTRAVVSGGKAEFMSTVDPMASTAFRDAQSRSYDGLRSVPLTDYRLTFRLDDSGDLAAGLDLARSHDAQRVFLPETRQSYRLDGYDDRPAIDTQWITYVERGGKWYASADDDLASIGLVTQREIWDLGPVIVQRTPHFLVIARPDKAERANGLASIAEEAMAIFGQRRHPDWSGRIPLIVPGTPEEANQLLQGTVDVSNFAAFVAFSPVRDQGYETTAPRMYTQDANMAGQLRSTQIANVVHELMHAAAAKHSGPFTPVWLQEGLAEHARLNDVQDDRPPTGHDDHLPSDGDFATRDPAELAKAYAEATSAVSYIAALKGPDAPVSVFEAVGDRRVTPGSPSNNVDAAFEASLGESLDQFEVGWAALPSAG